MRYEADRYSYSVLTVCHMLHGSNCHSGDVLGDKAETELVDWLRRRAMNWSPSNAHLKAYENAVYSLVMATLAETGPR